MNLFQLNSFHFLRTEYQPPAEIIFSTISRKIAAAVLAAFMLLGALYFFFWNGKSNEVIIHVPETPPHVPPPFPHTNETNVPPKPIDPYLTPHIPPLSPPKHIAETYIPPKPIDPPKIQENLPLGSPLPFSQIEGICGDIAENILNTPSYSTVKALSAVPAQTHQHIVALLNEIVTEFEKRHVVSRKIKYGDPVPAYFANVIDQSYSDRKYLSLVGLRNLLLCGPAIIDDFASQKFIGGEHHYSQNKGLNAFKYYTGNLVDLDTEIDATSDAQAIKEAEQLIIHFGRACGLKRADGGKLTASEVARALPQRKLQLPPSHSIHLTSSHLDRSNYGIWKRIAPSGMKTHYYVNTPNCDLVILATLRLPYLLAELLYRTKEHRDGALLNEFFDKLFSEGISDKCFNDKARTFMEFYHIWSAKLDQAPTPEEEARTHAANGTFGEDLKQKNPDDLINEAFTRAKLCHLLMECDHEKNGRNFEQWLEEEEAGIISFLQAKGIWETVLYRTDESANYFLLNNETLKVFLEDYYQIL